MSLRRSFRAVALAAYVSAAVLVPGAAALASEPVTITMDRASEILLSYPTPKYPIEARRRHITGIGVFEVRVDSASGAVTDVAVVRSTGFEILDRSATDTLKRWKFRPNKVAKIRLPITFKM